MPGCEHKKTEFLMRRDGIDYMRCVSCDQVFEADDLEIAQVDTDDLYEEEDRHAPRHRKAS